MKKLWKDNGGYALIYVLIVVLVLCAVAVSVCTAALKNYQAQERSIRQTQQLYQAEGEIEKFVALAEHVSSLQDSAECNSEDEAKAEAKAAYVEHLKTLAGGCTLPPDGTDTDVEFCTFTLTRANDAVRIETKLKMELKYKIEKQEPQPGGTFKEVIKYTAKVSKASHNYSTYTITHLTAEGGASE
jgi:Na+-transporting NADH:ubiquinone oxidoreductase subunit NqrC